MFLFRLLIIVAFWSNVLVAQDSPSLPSKFVHPFESSDHPQLRDFVNRVAEDVRLVGLGECSHYTRECYLLKTEMIKALASQGFGGLVLEVDVGQAMIWDDYIIDGNGDLDAIIATSGWFTYRTEEFKELLRTLRAFNESSNKRFRIFGMEMTAVNHNVTWLKRFVEDSGIGAPELLDMLQRERPTVAFGKHSASESMEYWELFHAANEFLSSNQEALVAKFGTEKLEVASHLVEVLRQYTTYVSQAEEGLQVELRDQFSARNVVWCINQLGDEGKLAIWAHNGHVTKRAIANYNVLGHYLQRWFGDGYYSIGFTMHRGKFGAYSNEGFKDFVVEPTQAESITLELAKLRSPYVVLDIRGADASEPRNNLITTSQKIQRDSGEFFDATWPKLVPITLLDSYDALIFIDESSTPTATPWSR